MIARDLIFMTTQQARNAVKSGTFEGKKFTVQMGLTGGDLMPLPNSKMPNSTFLLDRHAAQKTKAASFAINLKTGVMSATFKEDLGEFLKSLGLDSVPPPSAINLHVQISTDSARYDAYFQGPTGQPAVLYIPGKKTGQLKYQN